MEEPRTSLRFAEAEVGLLSGFDEGPGNLPVATGQIAPKGAGEIRDGWSGRRRLARGHLMNDSREDFCRFFITTFERYTRDRVAGQ